MNAKKELGQYSTTLTLCFANNVYAYACKRQTIRKLMGGAEYQKNIRAREN